MRSPPSLGYWLVDPALTAGERPYLGLDRQPAIPGPELDAALAAEQRHDLLDLRDRYWDVDDSGAIHRKGDIALEFKHAFAAEGIDVDVLLAEFVDLPELSEVPEDLAGLFEELLARWAVEPEPPNSAAVDVLGIDVTYPFPSFHSAIRQPVAQLDPDFLASLNDASLFADTAVAREAAAACNRLETAWRPFCCIRITHIV